MDSVRLTSRKWRLICKRIKLHVSSFFLVSHSIKLALCLFIVLEGFLDTGLICREYKHPHFMRDYPALVDRIRRNEIDKPGSRKRKQPTQSEDTENAGKRSKVMRSNSGERDEARHEDEENYEEDIGTVSASRMLPPPPPLHQISYNTSKCLFLIKIS